MVDPAYLADISDRLNLIDREFKNEFVNLDGDRKALTDMLQTLENVDQVSYETLQTMENDLTKITPKSEEVEKIYAQVKKIVTVSVEIFELFYNFVVSFLFNFNGDGYFNLIFQRI
jgi:hypothetical protein